MPSSWHVYILECRDGTYYTGSASNLESRIKKHNCGKGARYTRGRRPVKLVYHETFPSRSRAAKREHQIKKLTRAQKEVLIQDLS